jgi:hypothetical protein
MPAPGTLLKTFGPVPIEWGKAREVARATFDASWETRYVPVASAVSPIAPPTYTMIQSHWGASLDDLDGLGLDMSRILDGEQEFEYLVPIRVGDWITAETRFVRAETRPSRKMGRLRKLIIETTFTNAAGEKAIVNRRTVLEFASPPDWS